MRYHWHQITASLVSQKQCFFFLPQRAQISQNPLMNIMGTLIEAHTMWEDSLGSFCVRRSQASWRKSAHWQPISSRCAGFAPASLSRCERVRVCVYPQRVHGTSALQPPHPHDLRHNKGKTVSDFLPVTPLLFTCPLAFKASLSSCRELRALMEQGMMDAERGRVIHRRKRTGTLAVVVAVQNVVVAACLIATLFLYLDFPKDVSTLWVERLSGEFVGKDAHTWFVFKNTLDDFFKHLQFNTE